MYNHIHITVNRSSYRSRARSLQKAREALNDGFSLGVFPEGGIRFQEFPQMIRFHDGAFRIAVECNIPVIPVTFLDNHHIFPDNDKFLLDHKKCRIVYHEPIFPKGSTEKDIKQLKADVYRVIQDELDAHHSVPKEHQIS